jgi:16S rRNA (guanine(966)-N(2))-methyltransferase RsmD
MSKPRIIAGTAKGRQLETPRRGTRPTPSVLREAVFDSLQFHPRGTFLDLFSGSGAMGLEAASRGWNATCVELSPAAAAVIDRNARALQLDVQVVRGDALKYVRQHRNFDVVFAAPPYPLDLPPLFAALLHSAPAKPGGLYLFQHPSSLQLDSLPLPPGASVRRRVYGSNTVTVIGVPDAAADETEKV